MAALKFFFSWRFLFTFIAVCLVAWSVHLWTGDVGVALALLNQEAVLNLVLWILAFVGIGIYALVRHNAANEMNQQVAIEYYGVGLFIAIALVTIFAIIVWDSQNKGPFAVVMGAFLATAGWLTSAMVTMRNHIVSADTAAAASAKAAESTAAATRKRHTLTVLIELRQSDMFNRHRDNIAARHPIGTKLTEADVEEIEGEIKRPRTREPGTPPLVGESLRYVTNYYEFLCAALQEGNLDETLLRQTHRQILVGYVDKVRPFIDAMVREGGQRTYEHLLAVVTRWEAEDAAARVPRKPAP